MNDSRLSVSIVIIVKITETIKIYCGIIL